jgi:hypothetical protein
MAPQHRMSVVEAGARILNETAADKGVESATIWIRIRQEFTPVVSL